MYKKYSLSEKRLACKNKRDTQEKLFDYEISKIITIDFNEFTYCFSCDEIQNFKANLREGENVHKKWRQIFKDLPEIKNSQIDMLLDKEECEQNDDEYNFHFYFYYEHIFLDALRKGDVNSAEEIYKKHKDEMDFYSDEIQNAMDLAHDKGYKKITSLLLQHDEIIRYVIKNRSYIANTKNKINQRCTPRQDIITLNELNTLKTVVTIKLADGTYSCYSPGEAKLLKSILKNNSFQKLRNYWTTQLPVRDTYKLLEPLDLLSTNEEIDYLPDD